MRVFLSLSKTMVTETNQLLEIIIQRSAERKLLPSAFDATKWKDIVMRNSKVFAAITQMEATGGEPCMVSLNNDANEMYITDCAAESPAGRRSLCYDDDALHARKENKPSGSAVGMANQMGIKLLDEALYRKLQSFITLDTKTSSWIATPPDIRNAGGALFGDWRYGHTFVYHNGAQSYYAARGFRGYILLKINS